MAERSARRQREVSEDVAAQEGAEAAVEETAAPSPPAPSIEPDIPRALDCLERVLKGNYQRRFAIVGMTQARGMITPFTLDGWQKLIEEAIAVLKGEAPPPPTAA